MPDPGLLRLECEACGENLHIEKYGEIVKCGKCGTEYRVRRRAGAGRPIALHDRIYYVETIYDGDHYVSEKNPFRFWIWIAALVVILFIAVIYAVFGGC